jgi:hypothetical protein
MLEYTNVGVALEASFMTSVSLAEVIKGVRHDTMI